MCTLLNQTTHFIFSLTDLLTEYRETNPQSQCNTKYSPPPLRNPQSQSNTRLPPLLLTSLPVPQDSNPSPHQSGIKPPPQQGGGPLHTHQTGKEARLNISQGHVVVQGHTAGQGEEGITRRPVVPPEVTVGACLGVDLGDASPAVPPSDAGKDPPVIWTSGESQALENAPFHTIAPHRPVPARTAIWMTGSTTTTAAPGATPATEKGVEVAVYCTTATAAEA